MERSGVVLQLPANDVVKRPNLRPELPYQQPENFGEMIVFASLFSFLITTTPGAAADARGPGTSRSTPDRSVNAETLNNRISRSVYLILDLTRPRR